MMFSTGLLTAVLGVSLASAAPTLKPRLNNLGLEWTGNSSLPKVLFLYTGGTISGGSDEGRLDTTNYGQLGRIGEEILAQVPEIANIAQIAVSNWTGSGGSTGTNDGLVMNMTRFAHEALCSEYSDIAGAVFTHGTNSLEETLFLGDLLINCGKPYVGLGAMRPWTALSFDGDANLFAGIALAASPSARNRGAMVAFNDRIVPGYWVTKTNANTPDTFKAYEQGYLGTFVNNLPYFFNTPSEPIGKLRFDISKVSSHKSYPSLPKVDIHYAMREFDGQLVLDSLKNGAEGVVIAGTGSGSVVTGAAGTREAMEQGLIVAVSTRSPNGAATPQRRPSFAKTGYIHPIQARIALQLMIASGYTQNQTNAAFEDPIRKATNQVWTY